MHEPLSNEDRAKARKLGQEHVHALAEGTRSVGGSFSQMPWRMTLQTAICNDPANFFIQLRDVCSCCWSAWMAIYWEAAEAEAKEQRLIEAIERANGAKNSENNLN